ncbi:unnamed protein product, partial [Protopolystoma xenopodis]
MMQLPSPNSRLSQLGQETCPPVWLGSNLPPNWPISMLTSSTGNTDTTNTTAIGSPFSFSFSSYLTDTHLSYTGMRYEPTDDSLGSESPPRRVEISPPAASSTLLLLPSGPADASPASSPSGSCQPDQDSNSSSVGALAASQAAPRLHFCVKEPKAPAASLPETASGPVASPFGSMKMNPTPGDIVAAGPSLLSALFSSLPKPQTHRLPDQPTNLPAPCLGSQRIEPIAQLEVGNQLSPGQIYLPHPAELMLAATLASLQDHSARTNPAPLLLLPPPAAPATSQLPLHMPTQTASHVPLGAYSHHSSLIRPSDYAQTLLRQPESQSPLVGFSSPLGVAVAAQTPASTAA